MAGQLTIDTLKASSGSLATQNGMTGIAKAWCRFTGSTAVIASSFNVSSITRNAAGDYTANFTTTLPDANYALVGNADSSAALNVVKTFQNASGTIVAPTTSAARFVTGNGSTNQDPTYVSIAVLGN